MLAILGLAAYGAASFWVVSMLQGNKTLPFLPKPNTAAATTAVPQDSAADNTPTTPRTTPRPTPTPKPTPTPMPPTPTPTPLQGPGIYACDPDGICGNYSDDMRKPCPKTFADSHCLGMCTTPSVRCPK
jgi:hypothetical protein